jgi:2,4-diketo-3-deoxy-L-fuconate hydrolase
MKLVRFGDVGQEKPGLVDNGGGIRDLSSVVSEINGATLSPESLKRLASVDVTTFPEVATGTRLGAPLCGISKIVAVGLNYSDHAAETGNPPPSEPILFYKPLTALNGPNDNVVIPHSATHVDWEVELGVVIGRRAGNVSEADALSYVAGYVLANDVSERKWQGAPGGQWTKGKSPDTFCPLGPWLVTSDEVADPQALDMWLDVNGEKRQRGNTRTMVFSVAQLVADASKYMTLLPGDVMITGTPPGVAQGMKPPVYLKPGDEMRLGIAGLGEQRQRLVAAG